MVRRLTAATKPRFFPGGSVQSQALAWGLSHTARPMLSAWAKIPFNIYPPNLIEAASMALPVPAGTRRERIELDNCRGEWIRGKGVTGRHVILYFHGGAFLTCGLNTHRPMTSRLSSAADAAVFSIEYRQMPRHTIRDAIDDGVAAYAWLLDNGFPPERITIAGDSAGGYLAFSVTRSILDAQMKGPAAVLAMSPLLDMKPDGKLAHRNSRTCQCFPPEAVEKLERVTRSVDDRHRSRGRDVARTEPLDMDLAGMPPSLIQIGSREVLVADAELMGHRLAAAGVECDLQIWDRQVHVFQAASSWVPEARRAIDEVAAFVRNHVDLDATQESSQTRTERTRPSALRRIVGAIAG